VPAKATTYLQAGSSRKLSVSIETRQLFTYLCVEMRLQKIILQTKKLNINKKTVKTKSYKIVSYSDFNISDCLQLHLQSLSKDHSAGVSQLNCEL
jgi:hypothetical protein